MPQTREHILLARQVGVPYIIVFLNKLRHGGRRRTALELVEMEVRELLDKLRLPRRRHPPSCAAPPSWLWKATRVLWANKPSTSWPKLWTPTSRLGAPVDGAFLMPVEDVFSISVAVPW